MNPSVRKIRNWSIGIGTLLLLLAIAGGSYYLFGSYSTGFRSGQVMKISKKGVIVKTWEGQLNMGGIMGGNEGDLTNVWEFSVRDDAVIRDLEAAVDRGERVKLYYREKFVRISLLGDTKYFVTKVAPVDSGTEETE